MRNAIPDTALCFFRDGNKWCCVFGDFINLQESPAGFGDTFDEALDGLKKDAVSGVESVPNFHVDNQSTPGVA